MLFSIKNYLQTIYFCANYNKFEVIDIYKIYLQIIIKIISVADFVKLLDLFLFEVEEVLFVS